MLEDEDDDLDLDGIDSCTTGGRAIGAVVKAIDICRLAATSSSTERRRVMVVVVVRMTTKGEEDFFARVCRRVR
jgi:hypothetical protein